MEKILFTSESVTEGHPDKIADQISDGVLDAILAQDPTARVACETVVNTGLVVLVGKLQQQLQSIINKLQEIRFAKLVMLIASMAMMRIALLSWFL